MSGQQRAAPKRMPMFRLAAISAFSKASECLEDLESLDCIADTSFLIALLYELDPFHEEAVQLFDTLADRNVHLYSTVTTRAEYLERQRRILLAEALMVIRKETHFEFGREMRAELTNLKKWIDAQIAKDRPPIPSDRELKRIRELLMGPISGHQNAWILMCQSQLRGKLTQAWQRVVDDIGITHIELAEPGTQQLISEKVTWEKACAISEETGIGVYDAMILNMLNCSKIPMIISTDLDFGFAVAASSSGKVALLPDRLVEKLEKFSICAP